MFMTVLVVAGLIIFYLWFLYNSLVNGRMRVREAWSQIDVQLKRRADLIPNLVEAVKGYAKHEKKLLKDITLARSALMGASGPKGKAEADNQLTGALKSLFAVAENYPQLKASDNFLQLQKELGDTEDKVSYARQFYNTAVMEYNRQLQLFPNVLIANNFGFKSSEFFETVEKDKQKVKVKFD